MVGDVYGLSFVGCQFCNFKIGRLGQGFCYLSVSQFIVPHFCVLAWHLKCTKHMGPNSSVVQ